MWPSNFIDFTITFSIYYFTIYFSILLFSIYYLLFSIYYYFTGSFFSPS